MAVCGEELSKNLGDISHVFKKKKKTEQLEHEESKEPGKLFQLFS